jgi:hypothetical protein
MQPALGGNPQFCTREENKARALRRLHNIHGTTADGLRYLVEGAGVDDCNGIYKGSGFFDGVPKYTMQSESSGLLFTLFRCTVPNGTKWWYISVADEEKPGTDKDVDYYANCSPSPIPPADQWRTTRREPPGGRGVPPEPTIRRIQRTDHHAMDEMDEKEN